MRKAEIVRLITEYMIGNNIFGEETLDNLLVEMSDMSATKKK